MLECRACVLRCIRAIAGDAFKSHHVARRRLSLTPRLPHEALRKYASPAIAAKNEDDVLLPGKQPIREESGSGNSNGKKQKSVAIRDEKALKIELKWLSDPVKLAEHVHYTLRNSKPDKALDLCRLASKKQEVIVSWNHVVDWYMSKGKIDDALKVYNEMKKRAQFPDSHTYVLLLRALAKKPGFHSAEVKESNVVKALSIYNSMSSPTSRVKPSIFHTNAVLTVCRDALDMDALWGVVSKLPAHGAGAPDHQTYSIILTAIRLGAFGKDPDPYLHNISARRTAAVQEGRKIWQEIIAKWRAGEIHIDEQLVCAMAQLLLFSKRMQDWDDVLSLVQQTMKIERLIPPLDHSDRKAEHVPQDNDARESEPEPQEDSEGYTDTPSRKAFNSIQPLPRDAAHPYRPTTLAYVQPGNPTLSFLIEACTQLLIPKTAAKYWDHLTTTFDLKPDVANFHSQLRLLGKSRASAKAAQLVREGMPAAGIEPKNQTFRIAMSACVRDKKNQNVLTHARSLVDVMEKVSSDPDVHTLIQYFNLACSTDNGPKIVAALDRLDPLVHNLRSRVTYGADDTGIMPEANLVDKEETLRFFSVMVGTIDTLLNRALVPRSDYAQWHARRSQLVQFIERSRRRLERERSRLEDEGRIKFDRKTAGLRLSDGRRVEKSGMPMSKVEWAARKLRWNGQKERKREAGRVRAKGLMGWDVGQAKNSGGFADSEMELAGGGGGTGIGVGR